MTAKTLLTNALIQIKKKLSSLRNNYNACADKASQHVIIEYFERIHTQLENGLSLITNKLTQPVSNKLKALTTVLIKQYKLAAHSPLAVKLKLYAQLIRLDKPIGILLLLWPTLIALWIAAMKSACKSRQRNAWRRPRRI